MIVLNVGRHKVKIYFCNSMHNMWKFVSNYTDLTRAEANAAYTLRVQRRSKQHSTKTGSINILLPQSGRQQPSSSSSIIGRDIEPQTSYQQIYEPGKQQIAITRDVTASAPWTTQPGTPSSNVVGPGTQINKLPPNVPNVPNMSA